MMPQNILIINQYACAPKYKAGVGERHFYLAKYFNQSGINTTIVGSSFNHLIQTYPKVNGIVTDEVIEGVLFKWIKIKPYKKGNTLGRVRTWFEFLFKLFFLKFKNNKPDVVLISTMSLLPLIYGAYIKLRFKAKLVHEVRDIWPLTPIELGPYSKRNPLILFLSVVEKIGFKKADAVVSVLRGYNDYLKERFSKVSDNFSWIPNGIEENLPDIDLPVNYKNVIPANKFMVVYAGSIGKANAMQYLVKASKLLTQNENIHFLIVGSGEEKDILTQITKGQNNVTYIDKVDKPTVLSIISISDVCYIGWNKRNLYKYGVSANKYNDYMLLKKPILSSINSKHDPVQYADCGIVVEAENSEQIADGIIKLYKMSSKDRAQLGENGFNYLNQNNLMSVLAKKYLALFKNI